jgi:hypothetical protein
MTDIPENNPLTDEEKTGICNMNSNGPADVDAVGVEIQNMKNNDNEYKHEED